MHSLKTSYDVTKNEKQKQLALAYQKGESEAAGQLLADYEPFLHKLSYSMVANQIDEDLLQDLRMAFLEKTKCYDSGKNPSFVGYIKQVMHWAKLNYLRKNITYKKAEAYDLDYSPEPLCDEIRPALQDYEIQSLVKKVSQLLNKNQREMFSLMVAGKSRKEIGTLLQLSPQSVCNKQRRIRDKLQQNKPLMNELLEIFDNSTILPDGYVNRHDFLFQHTWGVE